MSPRSAVEALVERVLGPAAASVEVGLVPADDGRSRFAVEASGGTLHVEASDGVAAASGLRHYLRDACDADPVDVHPAGLATDGLPRPWPDRHRTRTTSPWRWRYHLNFCTFAYTTAFWDWDRWEREIDVMAMSGVNLPLATVGFEGPWLRVLEEFGMPADRALRHLGSPAYLPWMFMGCLHDHGSPMTAAEAADQVHLGRRILERQRQLGMTPVLPGFTGYLPGELAGDASRPVDWMGFTNDAVDPRGELYREFGAALLAAQQEMFGSDGYYAVDPFSEGTPPVQEPAEVAEYAAAVAAVLTGHDPGSTWVLQGWPFGYRADYWNRERIVAFLGAMPAERMLVLDLWAEHAPVRERAAGFAGRPWCWTMLHSLGGRPGLHGALDVVAREPGRLRAADDGSALVGIGSAMEPLGHDPVVYTLLADVRWTGGVDDLDGWVDSWVRRRYGRRSRSLQRSWREIVELCYRDGAASGPPTSVVMSRPSLDDALRPRTPLNLTTPERAGHGARALRAAWDGLVAALAEHPTPTLERDVVEVGLDVLARRAAPLLDDALRAHAAASAVGLAEVRRRFTELILAMDRLAASHPEFRLDTWIGSARARGGTVGRSDQLERDAKRLLTVWVAPGHRLSDYAGRHWSGLLAGYYLPRWELWFDALASELGTGGRDVEGFERALAKLEDGWIESRFTSAPTTEPADVASAATAARAVLRSFG
jgi:alpha-N-acetylglucosaminidase